MQRDTLVIKSLNAAFNDSASGGRIAYPSFKQTSGQCLPAGILFLLLLLLNGCTEGQVFDNAPDQAQMVALRFSSPGLGSAEDLTRAETKATPEPELLPTGATVRIAAYYHKATEGQVDFATVAPTYQATYEVTTDGSLVPCVVDADGKKTAGTANGLTVRGGTYDFYAVSPARPLQPPASSPNDNYHISGIRHKEDVMTSFARNAAVSQASNVVVLNTFVRKCALLVFNVAPSPQNVLPFDELYGTKLLLKRISTETASLVAGQDIPLTGGVSEAGAQIEFTDFEPVSEPNPTHLNKTKGIILPKNKSSFDVSITVQRDHETATLSATIDKQITFDAGKRYLFTLEVKNNESRLQMTVQEWAPIPFTDNGVGGSDSPPDPEINPGTGTTITVAEWKNIPWKDSQVGKSYIIKIDQKMADEYNKLVIENSQSHTLLRYPPFNYDGGMASGYGYDIHGVSSSCTLTEPYTIFVEESQYQDPSQSEGRLTYQKAIDYCKTLSTNGVAWKWRVPTNIELFAMWYTCKGNNTNATDDDPASTALGEKFIPFYYWSSSVYGGNVVGEEIFRCRMTFSDGSFVNTSKTYDLYVRCVRETTNPLNN